MPIDFVCIKSRILLELPPLLFEAQSADGSETGIYISRLFHNKLTFLGSGFLRCYLSYFSPEFVWGLFGLVGLFLFFAGIYLVVKNRHYLLMIVLLVCPLFLLFEIPKSVAVRVSLLYLGEGTILLYGLWGSFQFMRRIGSVKGHKLLRDRP